MSTGSEAGIHYYPTFEATYSTLTYWLLLERVPEYFIVSFSFLQPQRYPSLSPFLFSICVNVALISPSYPPISHSQNRYIWGVVFLVSMALLVLVVPGHEPDRLGFVQSSFLGIVSWQFILVSSTPVTGYNTKLDNFMLIAMVTVFAVCASMLSFSHRSAFCLAMITKAPFFLTPCTPLFPPQTLPLLHLFTFFSQISGTRCELVFLTGSQSCTTRF